MRLRLTLAAACLAALPLSFALAQNRGARAPAPAQACTDFYAFANATWLRANPLPAGAESLSRFGQMQAQAEATRTRLLSEVLAAPQTDAERLLAAFWAAGMNTAAIDAGSAAAVQNALKPLTGLKRARDLPKVSAEFHAIGLAPMIEFVRLGDGGDGVLAAVPVPLGLTDPAFYTRQEPEIRSLLGKYRTYVEAVLRASGLPEAEISPASEAVLQIETQIAQALDAEADDARQSDSLRAQDRRYAALGLTEVLKRLDVRTSDLVVLNPAYFATLAQLGSRETPQRLQWYLRFRVLNRLAPDLGSAFRSAHSGFFINTVQGLSDTPTREEQLTAVLRRQLPGLIDSVVNARLVNAATRSRAEAVLQSVQKAAAAKDPAFSAVKIDLAGSLQPPFTAEGLRFEPTDHAGNLLRLWQWQDRRALKGSIDGVASFAAIRPAVQFDASSKTLTVTAAALTAPLLGAAPGAADFGGLGALAGHELSKAVDSSIRATGLGPLYNGFEAAPGLRVDGARTLPMNRADLAGLEFAWVAFNTAQPTADAAAKKAFFQAWAELWATQQSPAALRATVQTSAYAPSAARVNGPLSQLPAFAETFTCRAGQNMRAANPIGVWR